MLAVMEASQSAAGNSNSASQVPAVTPEEAAANEKEFLSSGRTGRRNALPDILGCLDNTKTQRLSRNVSHASSRLFNGVCCNCASFRTFLVQPLNKTDYFIYFVNPNTSNSWSIVYPQYRSLLPCSESIMDVYYSDL